MANFAYWIGLMMGRPAQFDNINEKMEFRMGINLGDILEKSDGSIYGDGVNVAARLESLATPGGINVSGSVYNSVRSKIPATFEFVGEQALKNITNPVAVYRLLTQATEPAGVETPQRRPEETAGSLPKVAVTPFTVMALKIKPGREFGIIRHGRLFGNHHLPDRQADRQPRA